MRTTTTAIIATFVTSAFAVAAGAADNAVTKSLQDAKAGAFDLLDKETVTVDFDKGASAVSDGEKSDLKALYDAAKGDRAGKVIVAAWSDAEYPKNKDQKLTAAERELADTRAKNIQETLKSFGATDVETHSMAEHPSWIARTFGSSDAKLKGTAEPTNVDDAVIQQVGKELRSSGGPGKAVVFIRRADTAQSH